MPLYLVSTPIGHPDDISVRALKVLKQTSIIIGEEKKETRRLIARYNLGTKTVEILNEHSTDKDIQRLKDLCQREDVVLVSDCGTPAFSDPGYQLVDACRKVNIKVSALPGASSLMCLIALAGIKVSKFYFVGFLPANTQKRKEKLKSLKRYKEFLVFMDTPYRLIKTLENIKQTYPHAFCVLGINFTKESEQVLTGKAQDILKNIHISKAEFMLLVDNRNISHKKGY